MDEAIFAANYKYLFHITTEANLARMTALRRIESASTLMRSATPPTPTALHRQRREKPYSLTVDGFAITLRDQRPLQEGHLIWQEGWDMSRFVELLNGLVFFWASTRRGTQLGLNHQLHYSTDPVLRICTSSIFSSAHPRFSWSNSGSPRSNPSTG